LWLTQGFDPACVPRHVCDGQRGPKAILRRHEEDTSRFSSRRDPALGRTHHQTERTGLDALAAALGNGLAEPFVRAVETLGSISGRVIVTGVGKSGHVGAKIAATLASTGTPSQFVHPAEANHGDLGMITRDDAIIVLSWSGETAELKGILAYSRRFQIPLIAFTSGVSSTLGAGG
jgi:D-arabinose 5-phosphate isomerase GutQ